MALELQLAMQQKHMLCRILTLLFPNPNTTKPGDALLARSAAGRLRHLAQAEVQSCPRRIGEGACSAWAWLGFLFASPRPTLGIWKHLQGWPASLACPGLP